MCDRSGLAKSQRVLQNRVESSVSETSWQQPPSKTSMSGLLEPAFLLELGAYAVAAAGIRLFKNRYSQSRETSHNPVSEADAPVTVPKPVWTQFELTLPAPSSKRWY